MAGRPTVSNQVPIHNTAMVRHGRGTVLHRLGMGHRLRATAHPRARHHKFRHPAMVRRRVTDRLPAIRRSQGLVHSLALDRRWEGFPLPGLVHRGQPLGLDQTLRPHSSPAVRLPATSRATWE
jgi:hypothetical protein